MKFKEYKTKEAVECCAKEEKVLRNAGADNLLQPSSKTKSDKDKHSFVNEKTHSHNHNHEHNHDHSHGEPHDVFRKSIFSFILLISAVVLDFYIQPAWFTDGLKVFWYLLAYLPVGLPVLKDAVHSILQKDIFSEFFLMGIATIGAFAIGEYPEAVAVMLFYSVGEGFQTLAVRRGTSNIQNLLDQRPDEVSVIKDEKLVVVPAKDVLIGEIVELKPGEKLGLDGELISDTASFNTAALTGESKPDSKKQGEKVLAGMINLNTISQVKVTEKYEDSKLSKILELVQDASNHKAPSELFIRKFARIYTPIVVLLATLIIVVPAFIVSDYQFTDWLYRALIFLVVSCPCALVISIPLGYFGGIGAASKHGVLVKGSNYLDMLANVNHVVLDKTGTLTEGVFEVQDIVFESQFDKQKMLQMINALEAKSTHPVATAIHNYVGEIDHAIKFEEYEEISGLGLKAKIDEKELLVGNFKLLNLFDIDYDFNPESIVSTLIAVAYDNKFIGYITIADSIKDDAHKTVAELHRAGIKLTMLSGDKSSIVQEVAQQLGIDYAYGDLLPEDKVNQLKAIKNSTTKVAFVGDGMNDAPVIALSDVGIAMGGLGSDAAIEAADVVIQDDKAIKIPIAIRIGKETKKIVWQNVAMAFIIKAIVMILGAGGIATMWEAVFADVGVALLAILNAVRILRKDFYKN